MTYSPWRQAQKLTVPAGGSATFTLADSRPMTLSHFTVWALTGSRVLSGNLTVQAMLNGTNLTPALIAPSGAAFNNRVFSPTVFSGNDYSLLLFPASVGGLDPVTLSFEFSNAGASDLDVSVYATGLGN